MALDPDVSNTAVVMTLIFLGGWIISFLSRYRDASAAVHALKNDKALSLKASALLEAPYREHVEEALQFEAEVIPCRPLPLLLGDDRITIQENDDEFYFRVVVNNKLGTNSVEAKAIFMVGDEDIEELLTPPPNSTQPGSSAATPQLDSPLEFGFGGDGRLGRAGELPSFSAESANHQTTYPPPLDRRSAENSHHSMSHGTPFFTPTTTLSAGGGGRGKRRVAGASAFHQRSPPQTPLIATNARVRRSFSVASLGGDSTASSSTGDASGGREGEAMVSSNATREVREEELNPAATASPNGWDDVLCRSTRRRASEISALDIAYQPRYPVRKLNDLQLHEAVFSHPICEDQLTNMCNLDASDGAAHPLVILLEGDASELRAWGRGRVDDAMKLRNRRHNNRRDGAGKVLLAYTGVIVNTPSSLDSTTVFQMQLRYIVINRQLHRVDDIYIVDGMGGGGENEPSSTTKGSPVTFGSGSIDEEEMRDVLRDSECIVCYTNNKSCVTIPCGHLCVCSVCVRRLGTCPVCRQSISGVITILKDIVQHNKDQETSPQLPPPPGFEGGGPGNNYGNIVENADDNKYTLPQRKASRAAKYNVPESPMVIVQPSLYVSSSTEQTPNKDDTKNTRGRKKKSHFVGSSGTEDDDEAVGAGGFSDVITGEEEDHIA